MGILDVDREAARAAAGAIASSGRKAEFAVGDVSSKDSVAESVGSLMAALGRVDILVNNAGICRIGKMLEMSDGDWRATFGINVDGLFNVSRLVVPGMVERRSGSVVNIASWMGKSAVPAYGAYCASKFAVVALTQTLAGEVGEYGVRVNAVAPGLIVDTKMRDESEAERRRRDCLRRRIERQPSRCDAPAIPTTLRGPSPSWPRTRPAISPVRPSMSRGASGTTDARAHVPSAGDPSWLRGAWCSSAASGTAPLAILAPLCRVEAVPEPAARSAPPTR